MRHILAALLILALALVAHADDPKPPWQRLLKGDDAKKAAALEKKIKDFEAADKYADAIRVGEELLDLRTKEQGADHWETVSQRWEIVTLRKVSTLPPDQRIGWRKSVRCLAQADDLLLRGQYPKALPLLQERLKWCGRILGDKHPSTGEIYNDLAMQLEGEEKHAEAGPLFHKATSFVRVSARSTPIQRYHTTISLSITSTGGDMRTRRRSFRMFSTSDARRAASTIHRQLQPFIIWLRISAT
jgi:hypothetical protein